MIEHDRRTLGKSDEPHWRTPSPLVDLLFREFPITIDLAACAEDTICAEWLGPGCGDAIEDALQYEHWADLIPEHGVGFLNPPYSRKLKLPIEPWIERCHHTAAAGRAVVAVLPAAVQTNWWMDYVWNGQADEIRFFPYRLSFDAPAHDPERTSSNANVNSAVVIWRPARPFVGPWTPHVRYWSYR